jgi:hypothetical protein
MLMAGQGFFLTYQHPVQLLAWLLLVFLCYLQAISMVSSLGSRAIL